MMSEENSTFTPGDLMSFMVATQTVQRYEIYCRKIVFVACIKHSSGLLCLV